MKFIPFFLALAYSSLIYGDINKAPTCGNYFSTNQIDDHYQRMDNGLVQDPLTGLTWYRCSAGQRWDNGQCDGNPLRLTFEEAQSWAASVELADFDDWRIPEIDEMINLLESDCNLPSINTLVFSGIEAEVYWSSEPNFWMRSMAWSLFFYRGDYFSKQAQSDSLRFMLVRN
jgi:hypothetical protein